MSQANDKVNPVNVIESLFIVQGQQEPSVQSENRRIDVVQNLKQALDKTSISLSFIGKSQMIALGVHGMPDTFIVLTMRKEGLSAHIAYKGHDFSPVSIGASDINPTAIKKKVYDAAIGDFNRLKRKSLLTQVYGKETIVVSEPVLASYNKNQTSKLLTIDTKLTVNKVLFDIRATRLAFNSMRGTPGTYVIDKLTMTCQFGRFIVQNKFSVNPKGKEPTKHLEHSSFIADVYKLLNEITFEHYELLQKEYAKFEEDTYLKDMAVVQDNGLITFVTGKSPGVERISQVHWLPVINITPGIVSDDSSVGLTNPTCNLGMLSFGSHTISNVLRFMKLLNCLGSKIREDKKIKISNAGFGDVVQSQYKKVRNSGISSQHVSKDKPSNPKARHPKNGPKYVKPVSQTETAYKEHTVQDSIDTLEVLDNVVQTGLDAEITVQTKPVRQMPELVRDFPGTTLDMERVVSTEHAIEITATLARLESPIPTPVSLDEPEPASVCLNEWVENATFKEGPRGLIVAKPNLLRDSEDEVEVVRVLEVKGVHLKNDNVTVEQALAMGQQVTSKSSDTTES